MENEKIKTAGKKTFNNFKNILPVLSGVILLISLVIAAIPKEAYANIFTGHFIFDPLIGGIAGSIAAGNPITSYVLGGEFLQQGISRVAVAAFIVTWVTVGIVQLPAESVMLGKRFALIRNAVSFVLAIFVAVLTGLTMGML